MKDKNLNSNSPDSDNANGNDVTDYIAISHETNTIEDVNRNAKALKNSKNTVVATDPNSDADLETKDTLAAETNSDAILEAKGTLAAAAEPNSDAELEAKDTLVAEPNSDAELEAKDTLVAEPNSDAELNSDADLETKDTLVAEPNSDAELNSDADLETKDTLVAEPNSDADLKTKETLVAEPNSDSKLEAKDTLVAEPNSDVDLETKDALVAEPNSDADLETKDTLVAEPNSDADLDAKDTLVAEPNSEVDLVAKASENGTDLVGVVCEEGAASSAETPAPATEAPMSTVLVPKYKYTDDQWSPLKMSGTKCYDLGLLKQIRDDPQSKVKPDIPMLDTCKLIRETVSFTAIPRPATDDALFPSFARGGGGGGGSGGGGVARSAGPRDLKKDGRNIAPSGKGTPHPSQPHKGTPHPSQPHKGTPHPSQPHKSTPHPSQPHKGTPHPTQPHKGTPHPSQTHKPVIHVSLSLRDDVKLNESENAWKPTRYKADSVTEEEAKTLELYKQFRGILNKLTPQKFDKLLQQVQRLQVTTQRRLEGVIDLLFEKAIEEPNFCEAYAHMCLKLYGLKVPADNATSPDQYVNFRALIITKCQKQFETEKVDETVIKLEAELSACTDPVKRKEIQVQLAQEKRKARMRSAGNVRFIGELYKLKMLTAKIMVFCMKHLAERLEEEKLECLCKLLTTIGQQVEGEAREQLDLVFRRMQQIVDNKSNNISSRVRFMLQDVIELRRGKWAARGVVDLQPKTLDQIQKEAEQRQRHIEIMNAAPMGGRGRDEGGRNRRSGDVRRQTNNQQDSGWKTHTKTAHYSVDTAKLKSLNKNVQNIKLAPPSWNYGSAVKSTNAPTVGGAGGSPSVTRPTATTNKYSVLAVEADDPPSTLEVSKGSSPGHSKGASPERSTNSEAISSPAAPASPAPQQPLPASARKSVLSSVRQYLDDGAAGELSADVARLSGPELHAALVAEILHFALEKSPRDVALVAALVLHLVGSGTVAADHLLAGLKDICEAAPDLLIDVPMLYDHLATFVAPLIEQKHTTFVQILNVSETIISSQQGHLLLRAVIKHMKDSMGPTPVMTMWQESGLQINQWMSDDQVSKFIQDNGLEFLEGGAEAREDAKEIPSHAEAQSESVQSISNDENCESIRGWVKV